MFGVSKRCSLRPKARAAPLTWARASPYEDRAAYYSKVARLSPGRIVELVRHYRTLAEIQRGATDKTTQQNHQSQNTINRLTGVALDF